MGYRLKFEEADPEQGVFFVDEVNQETRVETVALNKLSQLTFIVPATLEPGQVYAVEVQNYYNKVNVLRRARLWVALRAGPPR